MGTVDLSSNWVNYEGYLSVTLPLLISVFTTTTFKSVNHQSGQVPTVVFTVVKL